MASATETRTESKECAGCRVDKRLSEYGPHHHCKDGLRTRCRDCRRQARKTWREHNPQVYKDSLKRSRDSYDPVKKKAAKRAWRHRDPEHARRLDRAASARRLATPEGRLRNRLSVGLNNMVAKCRASTDAILGYTVDELRTHLERQFVDGMNWGNMGEWHIDHIVPASSFSVSCIDDPELRRAWALTNLRPLWANDNLIKGAKSLYLV